MARISPATRSAPSLKAFRACTFVANLSTENSRVDVMWRRRWEVDDWRSDEGAGLAFVDAEVEVDAKVEADAGVSKDWRAVRAEI